MSDLLSIFDTNTAASLLESELNRKGSTLVISEALKAASNLGLIIKAVGHKPHQPAIRVLVGVQA